MVLTHKTIIVPMGDGLKRGKAWRRLAALRARLGQKDVRAREFNIT